MKTQSRNASGKVDDMTARRPLHESLQNLKLTLL